MFGPLFWQLRMADVEVALLLKLLAPNESALLTHVICSSTNFLPCASRLGYNAPGAYPVNFLLLNPDSAGSLFYVDDKGWHDYNGLHIQLTKRFSHGLIWQSCVAHGGLKLGVNSLCRLQGVEQRQGRRWRLGFRGSLVCWNTGRECRGCGDLGKSRR